MFELAVGEIGAIAGKYRGRRDFAELMPRSLLETEATRSEALDAIGLRLEEALASMRAQKRSARLSSDKISKPRRGGTACRGPLRWRA
jgi:hypothetical protein